MGERDGIRIRRASADDVEFMLEVVTHEEVQPFLGVRAAFDRDRLLAELERQEQEPQAFGRFVIEVDVDGEWNRAGTMGFAKRLRRIRRAPLLWAPR